MLVFARSEYGIFCALGRWSNCLRRGDPGPCQASGKRCPASLEWRVRCRFRYPYLRFLGRWIDLV